jgi:2-keto-4-pentenoate hydratase/2-oxohepta-3-ene-1,7-dioic acid hydratase in catechol pathway
MRLLSFRVDGGPDRAGVIDAEAVLDSGLPMRDLLALLPGTPPVVAGHRLTDVTRRPAVPDPGKIMCIGRNYHEHAREQDVEAPAEPLVFAKYPSALIAGGEPIELSPLTEQTDWEAELVVVIGRPGKRIAERDARGHVAGYTVMNDVSARDLQRGDGQWTRAKSLDTFAPLSSELVTADEIADPHDLGIRCWVDGALMQDSTTALMIHRIPKLIAHLSDAFTLHTGDLIATGTPAGVGAFRDPPVFLRPGDVVRCEVEGVGSVESPVRAGAGM